MCGAALSGRLASAPGQLGAGERVYGPLDASSRSAGSRSAGITHRDISKKVAHTLGRRLPAVAEATPIVFAFCRTAPSIRFDAFAT
jgi:hypothetical protein